MSIDSRPSTDVAPLGFFAEAAMIVRRGREAWVLVSHRQKLALSAATLVMALTSACSTAIPLFLGQLVDAVQSGTHRAAQAAELYKLAAWYLVGIGVAYLLREALNVLRRYLVTSVCTSINREMYLRLMGHLLTVPVVRLAQDKVGALHGRIGRSVDGLVRFLRLSFLDFVPAMFTGLFALVTTVTKSPMIGAVMLGVIPLSIFLTVRQLMSQKDVRLGLMKRCEEIDGAIVEQLGGIEYIRAANTLELEVNRLSRATEARRVMEVHHHFEMSLFGSGKALNEGLFHILVLSLAIHEAIQGRLTFGDVLTFSILFLNVMNPLGEIHRVLDEGHESSLQVAELLDMLAIQPDMSFVPAKHSTRTLRPHLVPGQPAIVVNDLHVEYNILDEHCPRALQGVSLTIRHGETIGIAGRSGGGKSTLVKVLLRLVHACKGQVMLGDVPLEAVRAAELGQLVGYVGQSPFVFAGTIADNIAYGKGDVTHDEIQRAAELAHLHDEISLLPDGYDFQVTERGQNLSGGQRQRLALARVLLKQPPIMILDEATSALDNICERQVQRALGLKHDDCTTILVAHRLSTLRDADCIFVFADGQIVESGSYVDLVAAGGVFAELVASAENGVSDEDVSPGSATSDRPANVRVLNPSVALAAAPSKQASCPGGS